MTFWEENLPKLMFHQFTNLIIVDINFLKLCLSLSLPMSSVHLLPHPEVDPQHLGAAAGGAGGGGAGLASLDR